jgi:hypothetical protein
MVLFSVWIGNLDGIDSRICDSQDESQYQSFVDSDTFNNCEPSMVDFYEIRRYEFH